MTKTKKRANKTRKSRKRGKTAYYFRGRNTAVIASSAAQAKRQKKRPKSDKIVATRKAQPGEGGGSGKKSSRWSTIRRDGKSKAKSRYGKGRGQGPKRKGR